MSDENNSFIKMALYLESFLSAPEGQLVKFENNKPIYTNGEFNKNVLPSLKMQDLVTIQTNEYYVDTVTKFWKK